MSYVVSKVTAFAGADEPGVGLVRPARTKAVGRILLVGDQLASLFVPPFQAICREHSCELHVFLGPDWTIRVKELAVRYNPNAVVAVHSDGVCQDIEVWRKNVAKPVVLQTCDAAMSVLAMSAAAVRVWVSLARAPS